MSCDPDTLGSQFISERRYGESWFWFHNPERLEIDDLAESMFVSWPVLMNHRVSNPLATKKVKSVFDDVFVCIDQLSEFIAKNRTRVISEVIHLR